MTVMQDFEGLDAATAGLVRGWADRHPALETCASAAHVVTAIRTDPDPVLTALLVEAFSGCEVAPRLILQGLMPRLRSLAALDGQAEVGDYVTHLWLRIRTYPLDRRPVRIASNLVLDTLKAVHAERTPQRLHLRDPLELNTVVMEDPETPLPSAEHVLGLAADLGLIDPPTHATLVSVYAHGLSAPAAAELFRVSPTTIRRRCSRGLRTLRAHAQQLVDAM
ncbi:hypothetical protein AADG42_18080 [Ammonicoccus fulvus]|uniref:Sigma-70 family RNA polymerase sigma factor n=1 Tax=Ammonicoccus fulvus TaxID=3138240 RepID=A0ABZ3FVQ6_9ACTN